jgi:hypothetical protein
MKTRRATRILIDYMPATTLLRAVLASDLPIFFEQQLDPVAGGLSEVFVARLVRARARCIISLRGAL